jgi:hypothetical protein
MIAIRRRSSLADGQQDGPLVEIGHKVQPPAGGLNVAAMTSKEATSPCSIWETRAALPRMRRRSALDGRSLGNRQAPGVAPNTLSNNAGRRSPMFAAVCDLGRCLLGGRR